MIYKQEEEKAKAQMKRLATIMKLNEVKKEVVINKN